MEELARGESTCVKELRSEGKKSGDSSEINRGGASAVPEDSPERTGSGCGCTLVMYRVRGLVLKRGR